MNSGLKYEDGETMGDMCQAIRDLREDEYRQGEQDGYRQAAQRMYRKGNSLEQIADIFEVAVGVVKEWLGFADSRKICIRRAVHVCWHKKIYKFNCLCESDFSTKWADVYEFAGKS